MTRVVFDPAAGLLTLRGHAGAGEKGQDLVCAALSVLSETAAAQPGAEKREGPGWRVVRADGAALRVLCVGFRLLERDWPDHVRYREVRA